MISSDFRPYAATANVLAVIERARTRNLPDLIGNDFLALAGIPEAVYGRVRQALEFLQLAYDDGRPGENLVSLAKAPEGEYASVLANVLKEAYREDFSRVDPTQDSQPVIIEAFRRYEPRSQTSRMVMLFLGLCRAANIAIVDAPRERKMQPKSASGSRAKRTFAQADGTPAMQPRPSSNFLDDFLPKRNAGVGNVTGTEVFAVTEDDIATIADEDFDALWEVLGKVARARAKRKAAQATLRLTTFAPEVKVEASDVAKTNDAK